MLKKFFALLTFADAAYWWLRYHKVDPGGWMEEHQFERLLKAFDKYEKECVD